MTKKGLVGLKSEMFTFLTEENHESIKRKKALINILLMMN